MLSFVETLKIISMKRKRKFYNGVVNHVYQRTVGGVHLFYTKEDCLVFLSILSVCTRSSNVRVLKLCIMHNHFHMLVIAESFDELSLFMDRFTSWFVRAYNIEHGRRGRLLHKSYGSAPKWEDKKLRSAIIYIGNNPVEKMYCQYAEDYQWNFLAYAKSGFPFSSPIVLRRASGNLKKALKLIDNLIELNKPLRYSTLAFMKARLDDKEYQQLTDYIVSCYSPFDFEELVSRFKSYDNMLLAMHSTTGSEYDIKEDRDDFSLASFKEMMRYMQNHHSDDFVAKMISLPLDDKFKLVSELQAHTSASNYQICKFLHVPLIKPAKI